MFVQLHSVTPDPEATLVEVARVSSSRENKREDYSKLINYLIKNNHWSPFEHSYMTVEIETSKAIAIQLLRHRSFTFQEFSQRYQDVSKLGDMFEPIELRKQNENNRQSSTEVFDPTTWDYFAHEYYNASFVISNLLYTIEEIYNNLLREGVSRETARFILPMCTKTRLFMTGTCRSWIHFLQIRDDSHAQLEIQDIAKEIKKIFIEQFPETSKALEWYNDIRF